MQITFELCLKQKLKQPCGLTSLKEKKLRFQTDVNLNNSVVNQTYVMHLDSFALLKLQSFLQKL